MHEEPHFSIRHLPKQKASDFLRVYATIFTVSSTPLDLTLHVGQPLIDADVAPYLEARATVTMSWHAAKMLLDLMSCHIKDYEEQFGHIPGGAFLASP